VQKIFPNFRKKVITNAEHVIYLHQQKTFSLQHKNTRLKNKTYHIVTC